MMLFQLTLFSIRSKILYVSISIAFEWFNIFVDRKKPDFIIYNYVFSELPAGILQRPFYNPGLPNYVNYARIGSILGSTMVQGFTDAGRLFYGHSLNDWWTNSSEINYVQKIDCLIEQYSAFSVSKEVVSTRRYNKYKHIVQIVCENFHTQSSSVFWDCIATNKLSYYQYTLTDRIEYSYRGRTWQKIS